MRHASLFTGIGGFDLAAKWIGWQNIFQVEIDLFCNKILQQHFPEVTRFGDIRKFNAKCYHDAIDVISGGFPCQPFSVAGRRRGKEDDRYLWPETLRIITEVKPTWIVLENVAGLFTILEPSCLSEMEIQSIELFCENKTLQQNNTILRIQRRVVGTIISEIRTAGYLLPTLKDGTPIILCIPACAAGAPHRRDRVWIVACRKSKRQQKSPDYSSDRENPHGNKIITNTYQQGMERWSQTRNTQNKGSKSNQHAFGLFQCNNWSNWPVESPFCRRNDGVSNRVDRLKSLGNAIVPQVAYKIFHVIEFVTTSNANGVMSGL